MHAPKDTNSLGSESGQDVISAPRKRLRLGLATALIATGFTAFAAIYAISPASAKAEDDPKKDAVQVTEESTEPLTTSETPNPQATAVPTPPRAPMTAEVIVASPRGFEPNVIRRRAGRMLLVIVNETGLPMLNLRTNRADGALLGVLEMPGRKRRLEIPMDLTIGRLRISDPQNPQRVLTIDVVE